MATTNTRSSSLLQRASHIALVQAHHELRLLIEALDLGRFVPLHLRRSVHVQQNSPDFHMPPEHLRLAFEELGPTLYPNDFVAFRTLHRLTYFRRPSVILPLEASTFFPFKYK